MLAAWSGLRPLIRDPASPNSKDLVRNHLIYVSPSNLITIAGGKWTTYRAMAQETVDAAVNLFKFPVGPCITEKVRLVGSEGWSKNMFIGLVQRVRISAVMGSILGRKTEANDLLLLTSMASRQKSRSILRTTMGIVLGLLHPWQRLAVNVGHCMVSV